MLKPEQIPDEVVEAAARATWEDWRAGGRQQAPAFEELQPWVQDDERKHAREAIAAAINAWVEMPINTNEAQIIRTIILPLPAEASNE